MHKKLLAGFLAACVGFAGIRMPAAAMERTEVEQFIEKGAHFMLMIPLAVKEYEENIYICRGHSRYP